MPSLIDAVRLNAEKVILDLLLPPSEPMEEGETEKSVWVQRVISNHKCATRSSSCRNKKKV